MPTDLPDHADGSNWTDPSDPSGPPDPREEGGPQLELSFPCEWRYRVIGEDADQLRAALVAAAGDAEHQITDGNSSRSGRYVSLDLMVTVEDDAHRLRVFAELSEHPAIRFVL